jgi:outer membrane protein insertion porin family
MKHWGHKLVAFLILALVALPSSGQAQSDGVVISGIDVVGNQRIDPETILAYTPVNIGDAVTNADLNSTLTRLFQTNLFQDIDIALVGDRMVITVDENPIINRISLEGNDVLKDEQLLEFLGIKPRRVFTRKLALEAKQTLIEIYRQSGRYAATIEPKIIELPDKRVDLVFEIDEGPLVKIKKIKFIGNESFSDRALRSVIQSREEKWYVFFTADDKYDANRLNLDVQKLRQFYLQNGFADIDVSRATGELLADRSGFVLTYVLEEGQVYSVNQVSISSEIDSLDTESLLTVNQIEQGDRYDVRILEESLSQIGNKLGELGYAFVNLTPEITLSETEPTLDIMINIGQSRRNYVEQININGNDRTMDRVIRRQFELVEGDSFNQLRLTRSERNIRNLGFFKNVSVDVLPGSSPEQSVVDVNVEETTTGSFQIGFGYSTFNKGSVALGITENNFLGTGRGARGSFSVSGQRTSLRLGVTEPYLFDQNLLGSADFINTEDDFNNIKIEKTGIELGVGFQAANDFRHRFNYELSQNKTTTSSTTAQSTSGNEGNLLLSEFSYSVTQDKRDNRIDPREGYMWRVTESVAGIGGDIQYLKSQVEGQYLHPLLFKRAVIGVSGQVGIIDGFGEKVPRSSRFLIGGRSVRGFDNNGIGPRDAGDDSAVGGNKFYTTSVNLTSDLGLDQDLGLRWTIFADAGSVWDTDYPTGVTGADDESIRSSLGYGLLWDTAIGPLSFMWAFPVNEKSYDKTRTFQFSFGGRF